MALQKEQVGVFSCSPLQAAPKAQHTAECLCPHSGPLYLSRPETVVVGGLVFPYEPAWCWEGDLSPSGHRLG